MSCLIWITIAAVCSAIRSAESKALPNFTILRENYFGYPGYGGRYHDNRIYVTSGPHEGRTDTSGLRLSLTLNKIGAGHDIKSNEAILDDGDIRYIPFDHQLVVLDAASYGPYLENRYRTPYSVEITDHTLGVMAPLKGLQGIVRMALGRYKRADATIALWDCDHFHQTKDWSLNKNLIALDFWETPDSNCTKPSSN